MAVHYKFKIEGDKPKTITLIGRQGWAMDQLVQAGATGCTPITQPAPRWSAYVHQLRKRGFCIDTITETHGGPFSGYHARYVLRSRVSRVRPDAA